jgi:hypothetical protein
MRILEVVCYPFYIGAILMALDKLSVIMVRENSDDVTANYPAVEIDDFQISAYFASIDTSSIDIKKSTKFLINKCSKSDFHQFNGTVMEWLIIEVAIYVFFLIIMILLMFKSRFITIGFDNSDQFEPLRLSIIINKAIYKAV